MLKISPRLFVRHPAASLCFCLAACAAVFLPFPASAEQSNHSAENSRGVYLYSLNVAIEKPPSQAPQVIEALKEPGTDGITLVQGWQDVEPLHGIYVWDLMPPGQSLFDQWVAAAMEAGKKINLAIRAGKDTPCWLFREQAQPCGAAYNGSYAGAKAWRFEVS